MMEALFSRITPTGKKDGGQLTFWCGCRTDWNRKTGDLIEPRPCARHSPVYNWVRLPGVPFRAYKPSACGPTTCGWKPLDARVAEHKANVAAGVDCQKPAGHLRPCDEDGSDLDDLDRMPPPLRPLAAIATLDLEQIEHELAVLRLVLVLIVIGVLLWLVETQIPMDATVKQVIRIVVIVCVVLYVLGAFGLVPVDMPVPRLRG